jgi:hypothetical protein
MAAVQIIGIALTPLRAVHRHAERLQPVSGVEHRFAEAAILPCQRRLELDALAPIAQVELIATGIACGHSGKRPVRREPERCEGKLREPPEAPHDRIHFGLTTLETRKANALGGPREFARRGAPQVRLPLPVRDAQHRSQKVPRPIRGGIDVDRGRAGTAIGRPEHDAELALEPAVVAQLDRRLEIERSLEQCLTDAGDAPARLQLWFSHAAQA